MDNSNIIRTVNVNEIERKYLIESINKGSAWEREFIIFQWFLNEFENETKIKVIFDLHSLSQKWVRVSKNRKSDEEAEKVVDYLDSTTIECRSFLGRPFVCKRRSIIKDMHLDYFIEANPREIYMLEVEGDQSDVSLLQDQFLLKLGDDVTSDISYRNINMGVNFQEDHLSKFLFLQKMFR